MLHLSMSLQLEWNGIENGTFRCAFQIMCADYYMTFEFPEAGNDYQLNTAQRLTVAVKRYE